MAATFLADFSLDMKRELRNYLGMSGYPLKSTIQGKGLKLSRIAAILGVDKSALWRWERLGVPESRVEALSKETGIPKSELRPDIWPKNEAPDNV